MLKNTYNDAILVPDKLLSGFVSDVYLYLSHAIREFTGSSILPSSSFDPRSLRSKVFIFSLSHWPLDDLKKLSQIPKVARLSCWHDDMFWMNEGVRLLTEEVLERCEFVLYANKSVFLDIYGRHESKSRWLPLFAAPYFHQSFNDNPIRKCLLTGQCTPHHYPLRLMIKEMNLPVIETIGHPGYQVGDGLCVRENYARKLREYSCCVTDSGKSYGACRYTILGEERSFYKPIDEIYLEIMGTEGFEKFRHKGQLLLKHFEIPASGSLLVADAHCLELRDLGYIPGVNYLEFQPDDFRDLIEDCCNNWENYESIRRAGWTQSWKHSYLHRREQLRGHLEEFGFS